MEDTPKLLKLPKSDCQTFGFVHLDTNGQNHGPVWKTKSFFFSEFCTVIVWQECYGKGNMKISFEVRLGEGFQLGMLIRTS